MEIFMKVNGAMIWPMEMAPILIMVVLDTKESGKMTCKTERASKSGQMEPSMRENIKMVKKTGKESSFSLTKASMKETSKTMKFQAMAIIIGKMVKFIRESGRRIK
jgi:hypothetical protein